MEEHENPVKEKVMTSALVEHMAETNCNTKFEGTKILSKSGQRFLKKLIEIKK